VPRNITVVLGKKYKNKLLS